MKDEFCRKFKKKLPEAFITSLVALFLFCVSFLVTPYISTILFIIVVSLLIIFLIALIDFLIKRKVKFLSSLIV